MLAIALLPTSAVITGIDSMSILDQAFEAANSYSKLTKSDIAAILAKTAPLAMDGKYEPFKTTPSAKTTSRLVYALVCFSTLLLFRLRTSLKAWFLSRNSPPRKSFLLR